SFQPRRTSTSSGGARSITPSGPTSPTVPTSASTSKPSSSQHHYQRRTGRATEHAEPGSGSTTTGDAEPLDETRAARRVGARRAGRLRRPVQVRDRRGQGAGLPGEVVEAWILDGLGLGSCDAVERLPGPSEGSGQRCVVAPGRRVPV